MTKYRGTLTFSSDRDSDRLQKYLTAALAKAGATGIQVQIKPLSKAGAKAPVQAKVEKWLKRRNTPEIFTPTQAANDLKLQQSTVWRIFKRLVEAGTLTEVARDSGPARYKRTEGLTEVSREEWLEAGGSLN